MEIYTVIIVDIMFLKEIEKIFKSNKEAILKDIKKKYDTSGRLLLLGESENYVFTDESNEYPLILRLGHSSHRDVGMVQTEIDWMKYLSNNLKTLSVPRIVPSIHGNELEIIPVEDSYFHVVGFEKAMGVHIDKSKWNESLFEKWGEALGELHLLSKQYNPLGLKRPDWRYFDSYRDINEILPDNHEQIKLEFQSMIDFLSKLPKGEKIFGLIHNDFHMWNFSIDENKISLFDFDDCRYDWFINDIAVILFHAIQYYTNEQETSVFVKNFLQSFFKGYNKQNKLENSELLKLPTFLKRQELLAYLSIFEDKAFNDPWCNRFLLGRKDRIEKDIPFILDLPNILNELKF